MNTFDIVFLAIIGLFALRGAWRGIVREVATIGGVIGGVILARLFYRALAPAFSGRVKSEFIAGAIAFVVIFLIVYIAGNAVSFFLQRKLRKVGAGSAERGAGAAFGALEATIVIGVFLLLIRGLKGSLEASFLSDSFVSPIILKIIDFLSGVLL